MMLRRSMSRKMGHMSNQHLAFLGAAGVTEDGFSTLAGRRSHIIIILPFPLLSCAITFIGGGRIAVCVVHFITPSWIAPRTSLAAGLVVVVVRV
jgi:hypothetical protein